MKKDKDLPRKALSLAANPRGQPESDRARAAREFDRAHWRAFIQGLLSNVRYEPVDLLPFEEVREKLRLGRKAYLGIQEISLDQIVGSVNRYDDFTRQFLPRKTNIRDRWQQIEGLINSGGIPPIEVYKVSNTYFVRDGNHRVSVARQLGAETIEAHVWEYPTRVPLEPNDDLDVLLIRAEYLEFLNVTQLDRLRPDQWIVLTIPGGYWQLEELIAVHRHWLGREQSREISWAEAVTDWYDNTYLPFVQKVQEAEILSFFPGRTEGDLVLWILRHWENLERSQGEDIPPDDVIEDFAERARSNLIRRVSAWVERTVLGKPVDIDDEPEPEEDDE